MRDAWDWFATRRHLSLGLALIVFGVATLGFETHVIYRNTPADAFVANIFTWSALMAFIGYGRRYLSFSNPLLRWARDASYPVYILHQTVIIVIGYWVIQQPWNAWTKYAVVLAGTMAICVALYEIIRRFQLARLLFGMKGLRKTPTGAGSPQAPVAARLARIADDVA
jgi:peptidoglycan/LPS O-acetylase OafA/YrhL